MILRRFKHDGDVAYVDPEYLAENAVATLDTDVAQRRLVLNLNKGNLKQKGLVL